MLHENCTLDRFFFQLAARGQHLVAASNGVPKVVLHDQMLEQVTPPREFLEAKGASGGCQKHHEASMSCGPVVYMVQCL